MKLLKLDKGKLDLFAAVLQQPGGTVVVTALLIVREGHDDVALGDESLALEPDQVGYQVGGFVLDVGGPASVEPAVLLGEPERLHRPVLPPSVHDVEVREEQDRLLRASAPEPEACQRRVSSALEVGCATNSTATSAGPSVYEDSAASSRCVYRFSSPASCGEPGGASAGTGGASARPGGASAGAGG